MYILPSVNSFCFLKPFIIENIFSLFIHLFIYWLNHFKGEHDFKTISYLAYALVANLII